MPYLKGKVSVFRVLGNYGWIIYVLAAAIVISGIVIWCFEIAPIYMWIMNFLPIKVKNSFGTVWTFISLAIGLLSLGIQKLISFLGSEARERKLYKKLYQKNKDALKQS